ncbi:MAG TPA: hypothetical protein VFQ36_03035 [Ktedonobacteraceae bacterium]|nr:hypothetical protein [Ktedonobacteraceae bacterium]
MRLKLIRTSACTLILTSLILILFTVNLAQRQATARAASLYNANTMGGCSIFPANNVWNYDVSRLPVHPNSANFVAAIGLSSHLHPDFGAGLYNGGPIGFPYVVVPGSQPSVLVSFDYASESDPGPYPIPANTPIEGGSQSSGDRHVLVIDSGTCKLYEMYASYPQSNGSWHAGSGAVWNLNSDALRPATWTSADAAGLPILPGLVNYDEVAAGVINHALRFTANQTQDTFLWPARHQASSSNNPNLPPMGLRLRLKASVNISSFSRTNQIILTALKHYGMIVADNGSSWFFSGTADNRWNNDDLHALNSIPGSDFEAVDESALQMNPNSAQVAGSPAFAPSPTASASPAHSPTASASGTHAPHAALTPEIVEVDQSRQNTNLNALPARQSNGTGNRLPLILGGAALLLGVGGAALLIKRRKRFKPSIRSR